MSYLIESSHTEEIEAARAHTGALVIGVRSDNGHACAVFAAVFGALGLTHICETLDDLKGIPFGADYAVVNLSGRNAAETAFNTWLARPHILISDDENGDALEGLHKGCVVLCRRDHAQFADISRMARESGCAGFFTVGAESHCSARIGAVLRAENGIKATYSILGKRAECVIGDAQADPAIGAMAVLAAAICGYDAQDAAALLHNMNGAAGNENVALMRSAGRGSESAFRVLALVDPGKGRRRVAFLSHMDKNGEGVEQYELPYATADIDLVYAGRTQIKDRQQDTGEKKKNIVGEIVPEVLSPGDFIKVKKLNENGRDARGKVGMMIETLRSLPAKLMEEQEPDYAV